MIVLTRRLDALPATAGTDGTTNRKIIWWVEPLQGVKECTAVAFVFFGCDAESYAEAGGFVRQRHRICKIARRVAITLVKPRYRDYRHGILRLTREDRHNRTALQPARKRSYFV